MEVGTELSTPIVSDMLLVERDPGTDNLCISSLKPLCLTNVAEFEEGSLLLKGKLKESIGDSSFDVPRVKFNSTESFLGNLRFVSPIRDK